MRRPHLFWAITAAAHDRADGTFNPFGNFDFTGTMRPKYPLSPKRVVPEHIPRPDYAETGTLTTFFWGVKTAL